MDDFDIEDIGNQKLNAEKDTIEKPTENDLLLIQGEVESKDFDNALDLFGDDFFNETMNKKKDNNIDILNFEPKTAVDFMQYKNEIISFYSKIPNEFKADFADKLIMQLINPLSSFQIADILDIPIFQTHHQ